MAKIKFVSFFVYIAEIIFKALKSKKNVAIIYVF